MSFKFLILHGPNLNLLGKREPEIYGQETLSDINAKLEKQANSLGVQVVFYQSNHEGDLIDQIQTAPDEDYDGIIINPGGYTHTSIALRDAIASIAVPVVEVHLSNIHAREDFRKTSFISGVVIGQISGFGAVSYRLALLGLIERLQ